MFLLREAAEVLPDQTNYTFSLYKGCEAVRALVALVALEASQEIHKLLFKPLKSTRVAILTPWYLANDKIKEICPHPEELGSWEECWQRLLPPQQASWSTSLSNPEDLRGLAGNSETPASM